MTADKLRAALIRAAQQLLNDLQPASSGAGLPPLQRAILRALTPQPQTAKRLAHVTGRHYNSSFRAAIRDLVDAGRARHTSQGYSLP